MRYRLGAHLRVQETLLGGRDGPIEGRSGTTGPQKGGGGGGGEMVVKTKHCWGLGGAGWVSPSKSGPESVNYYLAVQYSWSIHTTPPTPGRRGWWAIPWVPIWMGFFYLKWRWALNQEITGSAAQRGWCPCSAACNSWCIHHPVVCA